MSRENLAKTIAELGKEIDVLYVEDEDQTRESISEVLEYYFRSVDSASNGAIGLEKYRKKRHKLVVSDIKMPVCDGITMCKEIKKIDEFQAIIITSAHSDSGYLIKFIELGVDGFLLKPLEGDLFLSRLYKVAKNINDNLLSESFEKRLLEINSELESKNRELKKALLGFQNEQNRRSLLVEAVKQNSEIDRETLDYLSIKQKKISASLFFKTFPISLEDKSDVLQENLTLLDIKIDKLKDIDSAKNLALELHRLSDIIYNFGEFKSISSAFNSLANSLEVMSNFDNLEVVKKLLFALLDNINLWIKTVFIDRNAVDIHYLDSSFLSDGLAIEAMIQSKNCEDDEDGDDMMVMF